jgi:hypothetical protein
MPSTDRKLELTAKASMAQPVSQPAVCSNGLNYKLKIHNARLLEQVKYADQNVGCPICATDFCAEKRKKERKI